MTIEKLIEHLQAGEAPEHKVIVAGHDSDNQEILFEPYSVRWEQGTVVIEADVKQ